MHISRQASSTTRRQGHLGHEDFLFVVSRLMLTLNRGSRRVPAPASPGRARDALGIPPKRGCPRADLPHPPPSGPPSRALPPKAPVHEATIPCWPRDMPSPPHPSPRPRHPFEPSPPPLRHTASQ